MERRLDIDITEKFGIVGKNRSLVEKLKILQAIVLMILCFTERYSMPHGRQQFIHFLFYTVYDNIFFNYFEIANKRT